MLASPLFKRSTFPLGGNNAVVQNLLRKLPTCCFFRMSLCLQLIKRPVLTAKPAGISSAMALSAGRVSAVPPPQKRPGKPLPGVVGLTCQPSPKGEGELNTAGWRETQGIKGKPFLFCFLYPCYPVSKHKIFNFHKIVLRRLLKS